VYRFSLERKIGRLVRHPDGTWRRDRVTLGDEITDKTTAEAERDRLRAAIRAGEFKATDSGKPQRETLTLSQLMETYRKNYIAVQRAGTVKNTTYQIGVIMRTELERADGIKKAFGEWLVSDIGTRTIFLPAQKTKDEGRSHGAYLDTAQEHPRDAPQQAGRQAAAG